MFDVRFEICVDINPFDQKVSGRISTFVWTYERFLLLLLHVLQLLLLVWGYVFVGETSKERFLERL